MLRADGHTISHVDLGGGLGIPYREDNEPPPDPAAYAEVVKRATRGLGCRLIFEPGRLIVGNAGILVTRVLYLKQGEAKTFVIVDAGMNDLVRPTLYDAHHDIRPVREAPAGAPRIMADVVGPVCESGDFFALGRWMVEPQPGDLLAVMTAGAYGAVQAGTYNTRALVPEVLVRAGEWARGAPARHRRGADRARPHACMALILLASGLNCLEPALMLTCCDAEFLRGDIGDGHLARRSIRFTPER